jgi:predicted DNA-binding mobile mystery protein A
MNIRKQRLVLEQMDRRLKPFIAVAGSPMPAEGWIYNIRKALNMSLRQIAQKIGNSPQGIKALEQREKNRSITIKSLEEVAGAMDMKLVYALVPKDGSLEELVNKKATILARQIVDRTAQSMALEDQSNSQERMIKAVEEKKNELKNEMPKYLWE